MIRRRDRDKSHGRGRRSKKRRRSRGDNAHFARRGTVARMNRASFLAGEGKREGGKSVSSPRKRENEREALFIFTRARARHSGIEVKDEGASINSPRTISRRRVKSYASGVSIKNEITTRITRV